jgi:protein CWC15
MTTAHRPTWHAAVGTVKNHGFSSQMVSAKDQIGETRLKFRQVGQASQSEMAERNVHEELQKREFDQLSEKNKMIAMIEQEEKKVDAVNLLKNHAEFASSAPADEAKKYNDADVDYGDGDEDFDSSRFASY